MVVDLVSSWCAAVVAGGTAEQAFRSRHHALLDAIRAERAPLDARLPLTRDVATLRKLARRAADDSLHQQLRRDTATLAAHGIDAVRSIALIAGTGAPRGAEALGYLNTVALFIDAETDDSQLRVAMADAAAWMTRESALGRPSAATLPSRWHRAQHAALREAIYTTGLGLHAAQLLLPTLAPHALLGVSRTSYQQLRVREKLLTALLQRDLDAHGLGPLLRWLSPDADSSVRRAGSVTVPRKAGHYLAWRMVAPRVARLGLERAMRMEA